MFGKVSQSPSFSSSCLITSSSSLNILSQDLVKREELDFSSSSSSSLKTSSEQQNNLSLSSFKGNPFILPADVIPNELQPRILQETSFFYPDQILDQKQLEGTLHKITKFLSLIPTSTDLKLNESQKNTLQKNLDDLFLSLLETCLNHKVAFGDSNELRMRITLRAAKKYLEKILIPHHELSHLFTKNNNKKLRIFGIESNLEDDNFSLLLKYRTNLLLLAELIDERKEAYGKQSVKTLVYCPSSLHKLLKKIEKKAATIFFSISNEKKQHPFSKLKRNFLEKDIKIILVEQSHITMEIFEKLGLYLRRAF